MPVITKLSHYDVFGLRDLINPPNAATPEKARHFSAKLFFLDVQDGTQDQIVPSLLERHAPPRTYVIPYDGDGHFCVVIYERERDPENNTTHIPALLTRANEYCDHHPRDRRVFPAETFFAEFPDQFKKIMKATLDIDTVLEGAPPKTQ
jgi:hypothetical protein